MRRFLLFVCLVLGFSALAEAQGKAQGFCENGGTTVVIPGTQGSGNQKFQQTFPSCTVTVYAPGTVTLATIYADNAGTVKANPFTAAANGQWSFFAASGSYDIKFSGGGIPAPFTLGAMNVSMAATSFDCASYPGATASAKITACANALPATGGRADAGNIVGAQTWTTDVFTGISKPVDFTCGAATYTVSTTSTIPSNVHLLATDGCIFSVNAGITFTVNGSLDGSLGQHFAGSGAVLINAMPRIYPQWFAGVDLGAKSAAALASLATNGGLVDATGLSGAQTISSNVTIGTNETLLLGPSAITLNAGVSILAPYSSSTLAGSVPCAPDAASCVIDIKRASGTSPMLSIGGNSGFFAAGIYVHDISLNGNGGAGDGIDISYAYNVYLDRIHVYNGGASSALNITQNVFDSWINDNSLYVWGDTTHPTINLAGGANSVTDIHFNGNQIGENGNSNPSVISDANTIQVSWVDNKFHTTGTSQPYKVLWGGYRSRWIGNSFQADSAACTDGMVHFTLGPNDMVGNEFTDVNNCSAVVLSGTGQANITGGTITGSAAGTGAILTTVTFGGVASVVGVTFEGMNTAIDTSLGAGTLNVIGNNYLSIPNPLKVNLTNTYQPIKTGYPTKYTPSYTGIANVTSTGGVQTAMYTVYNDLVIVNGTFVSVTPTTSATLTQLDISLPVASTLAAQNDCIGLAGTNSVNNESGTILADTVNHKCELYFIPNSTSTRTLVLNFSYRIDGIVPDSLWTWLLWNLAVGLLFRKRWQDAL
jgi:hypothetical protein